MLRRYDVLTFLGAQINYGGRVTDDKDKRLITCILKQYVCQDLVEHGKDYAFSKSGTYYCPDAENIDDFLASFIAFLRKHDR